MNEGREFDIDDEEEVSCINNIVYADNKFFLMCNKRMGLLGQFLVALDTDNINEPATYFIHWSNKLDISDCDMQVMTDKKTKKVMNIVVSFKNIGINTYNVFVYDVQTMLIKYNFEAFQLWESKVKGFLLKSNEFMILNKDGTSILSLKEGKGRVITDNEGFERFIHPLSSCNFLKLEPSNHLQFSF
jgi:hypothetical protein